MCKKNLNYHQRCVVDCLCTLTYHIQYQEIQTVELLF